MGTVIIKKSMLDPFKLGEWKKQKLPDIKQLLFFQGWKTGLEPATS